jgi:MerR family transcriptional regulator, light-induced transcriptional regulator
LQKTILSTADVARLFNVTETTVKRWADDGTLKCQKTPGGHRKFPMRNVIEFAEKNQFEPVGALELPSDDTHGSSTEVAILGRDFNTLTSIFVEKALSLDRNDLALYLSFLYQHRIQLWEIYDHVLRPGLQEIGERWARGEISVSNEHRASYETLDALAKLQGEILIKPPTGKSALFACIGEEFHEIGLRCVSYLFESEGWVTHYLGANTPREALIGGIHEIRPSVVCLSFSRNDHLEQNSGALDELARAAHEAGASIVAGGRVACDSSAHLGMFDGVFGSSKELLGFIELMNRNGQRPGPHH